MRIPTHSSHERWKNFFIRHFIKTYSVNMADAVVEDFNEFTCFNAFFTRAVKESLRPIAAGPESIVCPADGTVSEIGNIVDDRLLQAKGKYYSLKNLLGGDSARSKGFSSGQFITVYLSPKDYHRFHMPFAGKLKEMIYIPGRLFSVNQATANTVDNLFGRNERVAVLFQTPAGPMAIILVGAIFVASIETVWHGVVIPPMSPNIQSWNYENLDITLKKGDEMGRFNMGSTVIVLFAKNHVEWNRSINPGDSVIMGQAIGRLALA